MPTSQDTISKVKNILRKMDQSIDAARNRRLSVDANPAPAPVPQPAVSGAPLTRARPLATRMPPRTA